MDAGRPALQAVLADGVHASPRHTHEEFGIGLMEVGGQLSASGRGQATAGAGDIIAVNPGEVHDGAPLRGEARRWRMLSSPWPRGLRRPEAVRQWPENSTSVRTSTPSSSSFLRPPRSGRSMTKHAETTSAPIWRNS